MESKPLILVVDDQPQNIELIEARLVASGYETAKATNGEEALKKISGNQIDLVLLDVMMPGMNGFEVCKIIKNRTGYLPVVMVTALNDRNSRIKGIESGADDFLTKPIDAAELQLKINNLLKTKRLYENVEKDNREIKALSELKDNLTYFIIHDLRSPLTNIKGHLDLLAGSNKLLEEDMGYVKTAGQSVKVMIDMISNLLDMTKMENNEIVVNAEDCYLDDIVSSAVETIKPLLQENRIQLLYKSNEMHVKVKVQRDMIERVVQNLLSNAIHYVPKEGNIAIACETDEESKLATVSISDNGCGIPKEDRLKIFDKYATVEAKNKRMRGSTGLGLTFCKLAVELHGGKIWVEDRRGGGSIFGFTLPVSGV